MHLYLVRHGQTTWNADGRAQGHSDIELDKVGHLQAERLAGFFKNRDIRRIFSSDLNRCVQTANPLAQALDLEVELREVLRERTFGVLEGQHYTSLRAWFQGEARVQGLTEFDLRPDDGESVRDVWKRMEAFEKELKRIYTNTVVILHGGSCGILMSRHMRGNVESSRSLRFENAAVNELIRRPDGFWQLTRYNDASHLHGLEVARK